MQLVDVVQTGVVLIPEILLFPVLVEIFHQVFRMTRSGGKTPIGESLRRSLVVILRWVFDDCVVDVRASICQVGILSPIAISIRCNVGGFRSLRAMTVVSIRSVGIRELQLKSLDGA